MNQDLIDKILLFLKGIGIETQCKELSHNTFLPGIEISKGKLLLDLEKIQFPGDILHEAGHLAILPLSERLNAFGNVKSTLKEEYMAIAWSWAALKHLDIEPKIVFHEGGYFGKSEEIINNFKNNNYFGVLDIPGLQWLGMTVASCGGFDNTKTYPNMIKWLND